MTFIWTSPFTTGDVGLVAHVAELGFDAIEVALEVPDLLDPAALAEAVGATDLEVVVVGACTAERDTSSADAAVRRAGIEFAKRCVDLAVAVGAPVVAGPLNHATNCARQLPPDEREREYRRAVDGVREAAEYAGERGVMLAIEPLNRWETDMLNTVEQGLAFCDSVGLGNVGLLLDTFHENIEEKSVGDAIRSAGDRALHVHGSENDRGIPGSGHVPWAEVAGALRDIAYGGVVSMESFAPSMDADCFLWRRPFDDPDAYAREGLAHLRATFG
jgi:D-psicose/D-tagatose/L-ribulose 3-epimerase